MSPESQSIFLVGIGFIGGSILHHLLALPQKPRVTVLTRKDEQIPKLKELGIEHVKGELSSSDVISEQTSKSDVCFIPRAEAR